MTNETLGNIQDEIARHLEAFHLPSMHVTALSGLLLADVFEPAIRAAVKTERAACAKTAYQYGCADARDAILRRSKGNMHDE